MNATKLNAYSEGNASMQSKPLYARVLLELTTILNIYVYGRNTLLFLVQFPEK
jgi:hypothetical protein